MRVAVVGCGAVGAASALALTRAGHAVRILERFGPANPHGSSHGGARIFRLAYDEPDYVRLAQESLPLWRELEDDAGQQLLITTGGIDHGPASSVQAVARALEGCGAARSLLSRQEAEERWPGMRFAESVVHQPDAGCCLAGRTVLALQERARHHGADVRFGAPATCAVAGDGVVVRAEDGEYRAPVAVVAAGAWATAVAPAELPALRVTKEQVFHFRPGSIPGPWPSFIHHGDPIHYGLLTPGEGVKVAEHHTGPEVDADLRDFEIDQAGRDRVVAYVSRWFPGLDPEPVSETTCLYTTTPTHDFVVDRSGPLVVAAGFSGHGFKFTPLIGKMLAELATGAGARVPRFRLSR